MISFLPGPAEAVPTGRYRALQEPDRSHSTSGQTGQADAAGEPRQLCTAEISGSAVQAAAGLSSPEPVLSREHTRGRDRQQDNGILPLSPSQEEHSTQPDALPHQLPVIFCGQTCCGALHGAHARPHAAATPATYLPGRVSLPWLSLGRIPEKQGISSGKKCRLPLPSAAHSSSCAVPVTHPNVG